MKRAVFLDRDGVVNPMERRGATWGAPLSLAAFEPYPWASESVGLLRAAGFPVLVVTNQPEIATGELEPAVLEAMSERLRRDVGVDAVYVCPHRDADGCVCRKPLPGLLRLAAREWNLDITASFMVGDRWRDVGAGRAAGCTTILVDGPMAEARDTDPRPDYTAADLRDAARIILTLARGAP